VQGRALAVGYLEEGDAPAPGAFDAVVYTPRAKRDDPCAAFARPPAPGAARER
jgi:hypothetical protein